MTNDIKFKFKTSNSLDEVTNISIEIEGFDYLENAIKSQILELANTLTMTTGAIEL